MARNRQQATRFIQFPDLDELSLSDLEELYAEVEDFNLSQIEDKIEEKRNAILEQVTEDEAAQITALLAEFKAAHRKLDRVVDGIAVRIGLGKHGGYEVRHHVEEQAKKAAAAKRKATIAAKQQ